MAVECLQVCLSEERRSNTMFPSKVRRNSFMIRQMSVSARFVPLITFSGWSPHRKALSLGCLSSMLQKTDKGRAAAGRGGAV